MIEPAIKFIQGEGGSRRFPVGVNPVLSEIWLEPRKLPALPANFYCYTQLIYLAISSIYGHRYQIPISPIIAELRGELDCEPIEHPADFRASRQDREGGWPKEEMAGVFFRTALLDYTLYRQYFPAWALALYETRRKIRGEFDRVRNEYLVASIRRVG